MGRVEIYVELDMYNAKEWKLWMVRHGIDINRVISPSTVTVDFERRRIITEEYLTSPPEIPQLVRVKGHRCFEDAGMIFIRRVHQHEAVLQLPDIEEWRITECPVGQPIQTPSDLDSSTSTKN